MRSRTQRDHQLLILKSVIRECARHPSKKSKKEYSIHDRAGTERPQDVLTIKRWLTLKEWADQEPFEDAMTVGGFGGRWRRA
jgi:hypothetical protein